jgi:hypothetical protein
VTVWDHSAVASLNEARTYPKSASRGEFLSAIPANTKVEQAILDEISKYVGGPNEVAPLGGLEAKLLQTGFLIGEIIDAMQSLQDEGSLAPGPSPGLIKITGAGFARL